MLCYVGCSGLYLVHQLCCTAATRSFRQNLDPHLGKLLILSFILVVGGGADKATTVAKRFTCKFHFQSLKLSNLVPMLDSNHAFQMRLGEVALVRAYSRTVTGEGVALDKPYIYRYIYYTYIRVICSGLGTNHITWVLPKLGELFSKMNSTGLLNYSKPSTPKMSRMGPPIYPKPFTYHSAKHLKMNQLGEIRKNGGHPTSPTILSIGLHPII